MCRLWQLRLNLLQPAGLTPDSFSPEKVLTSLSFGRDQSRWALWMFTLSTFITKSNECVSFFMKHERWNMKLNLEHCSRLSFPFFFTSAVLLCFLSPTLKSRQGFVLFPLLHYTFYLNGFNEHFCSQQPVITKWRHTFISFRLFLNWVPVCCDYWEICRTWLESTCNWWGIIH